MSEKPNNAIWCPVCGGDKGFSVPDRIASIGSIDGYAERWEECRHCDAHGWVIPECISLADDLDFLAEYRATPDDMRRAMWRAADVLREYTDMLEALQAMITWGAEPDPDSKSVREQRLAGAWDKARAAIARAGGR